MSGGLFGSLGGQPCEVMTVFDEPAGFLLGVEIPQSLDLLDGPPRVGGQEPSQVGDDGPFQS